MPAPTRRQVLLGAAGAAGVALTASSAASAAPRSSRPSELTLVELLPLLQARTLSATELVTDCLRITDALEPQLQAFVTRTPELALAAARVADDARAAGRRVGPLAGVPVGLKDLYYTAGVRTTAGSRVLADFVPDTDATVWERLREAGAGLAGKTNTHEFAYGTSSPPTRNPWDPTRNPGGSSGGSGAALAARMLPVATGSDTGGSLRIPAAVNGICSLRATYGRVSRAGVVTLAWSLDTTGGMARRMLDVALLLGLLAGHDPRDPTSLDLPVPALPDAPPEDLRGTRIGIPDRFFWEGVDADIVRVCREGLQRLEAMGAELVEIPVPTSTDAVMVHPATDVYVLTNLVEATSYHRQLVKERAALYSPEVLALLEAGEALTGPDYVDAQRRRSVWARQWREIFATHGLAAVAHPTVQQPPGEQVPSQSFTVGPQITLCKAWSNNGFPSLSVPVGLDSRGLPVGLLLAGLPLAEAPLLSLGIALDEDVRFFEQRPPVLTAVDA
jgi:aspartyl-tRNA(Asn)/glutamyl-tRNA(Gln) amidotransferase subunit A